MARRCMTSAVDRVRQRLVGRLVPAVPVPHRGSSLAADAQRAYAQWMAGQDVAGVAVWAHTGRGPHLEPAQRRAVLTTWRAALPDRLIVAGATSLDMAREASALGADALLAFPRADDPVGYHAALAEVLPVIAFWLYTEAGGVAYGDDTVRQLFAIPGLVGIKVATLDSVITFQRIADLTAAHPARVLITGEDRFLGYSLMMGARAALVGMGAALTDLQARLLRAHVAGDWDRFVAGSAVLDRFARAIFRDPMEGYVRRMLWAAAADGAIPADACDDPWGPPLEPAERDMVRQAAADARAAGG